MSFVHRSSEFTTQKSVLDHLPQLRALHNVNIRRTRHTYISLFLLPIPQMVTHHIPQSHVDTRSDRHGHSPINLRGWVAGWRPCSFPFPPTPVLPGSPYAPHSSKTLPLCLNPSLFFNSRIFGWMYRELRRR